MYDASVLSSMPVGSVITGIQLRLSNLATTNFPASTFTAPRYDLRLAQTTLTPATMSITFANNLLNPVLVRSGSLTLNANSYTSGASATTPEAWGPVIPFTTPYAYAGGPLVMEFRTTSPSPTGAHFADQINNSAFGASRHATTNADATTSTNNSADVLIVQLTYTTPTTPFQTGITKLLVLDDFANERGTSTATPLSTSPRTVQTVTDASEMARLAPGSQIVGATLRSGSTGAWPTSAQSFSQFDVTLATALTTPATMNNTFASNMGANATTVRSGALSVGANVLPPFVGVRPAPWAWEIPFSTPFSYNGGPLAMLIRHNGVSGGVSGSVDALSTTDARFGTRAKAVFATNSTASVATSNTPFPLQRLSIDAATVVPNINATTDGTTSLIDVVGVSSDSTVQLIVNASELTYLPIGSQITGFTLRANSSAFPSAAVAYRFYNVDVSTARNKPRTASTTFANNEGADKVNVRSGPLSFMPADFPGGGSINPFGKVIQFQRPFVYKGGDLCITVRRSGPSSSMGTVDASADTNRIRQISASGATATSGSPISGGPILRLSFVPSVVAPASAVSNTSNTGYSPFFSSSGQVLQAIYAASELRGLRIGSVITGISYRQSTVGSVGLFPATDFSMSRFDLTLSTSPRAPLAMSDTFANNIGSDAVLVRSGPITIPANAFPSRGSSTTPNDNVWFIQFTEPFVYKGGDLSVTLRNNGLLPGTPRFLEAAAAPTASSAGRWSTDGVDATVQNQGSNKGVLIPRFAFVPQSFCPADLNNDGVVDDIDFQFFVLAYNLLDCTDPDMPLGCPSDLNYDSIVDDLDFQVFITGYNAVLCP